MLQEVLAEGKWKAAMKQEDWRGLTPLFYQHVNPYGRFTLDLTQRIPLSLTKLALPFVKMFGRFVPKDWPPCFIILTRFLGELHDG